jgi:magnesium transporter
MLSYYAKRSSGEEFEKVKTPTGALLWVRGEHVGLDDVLKLSEQFGLNHNILDDITDSDELPRADFDDGKEYIFLRVPQQTKKGKVSTLPLLVVLDDSRFFSLSHKETLLLPSIIQKTASSAAGGTGLLLATLAGIVSMYEELIQHTERTIQDTGQRLHSHEVTNHDFIHFVTVEDNLNQYQMNLEGMLAVAKRLEGNSHHLFTKDDEESLDDITLHIQQLLVGIDTYFKSVESIRNAYSTIANNTLNERMKTLTVFTVLIALPNVFFGMYGMNVILPFADQPWAYGAITLFAAVLIGVVYALAKRLRIF